MGWVDHAHSWFREDNYKVVVKEGFTMAHKRTASPPRAVPSQPTRRTVTIKKASNGFVISSFNDATGDEILKIAKTKSEAKEQASKMLGV